MSLEPHYIFLCHIVDIFLHLGGLSSSNIQLFLQLDENSNCECLFSGRLLCQMQNSGVIDVNRSVAVAQQALQGEWGQMSGAERAKILLKAALIIRV